MKETSFLLWLLNFENKQNVRSFEEHAVGQTASGRDYFHCRQKKFHNPPSSKNMVPFHSSLLAWKQKKQMAGPPAPSLVLPSVSVSLRCCDISLAFGNTVQLGGMMPPALFTVVQTSPFLKSYLAFGNMPLVLCDLSETSVPVFSKIRHMCAWDSHVFCNSNF